MENIGKLIVGIGSVLVVVGLVIWLLGVWGQRLRHGQLKLRAQVAQSCLPQRGVWGVEPPKAWIE